MAKKKKRINGVTARGVPCTRNAQSWTEAEYWGRVRGALRQVFSRWKPAQAAFKLAECGTRINPKTGREKKIYRCAICGEADYREAMQVDHIEPCGTLRSPEDIAPFLAKLTCEDTSRFQLLHKACHQAKTNEARRQGNVG